MKNLEAVVMDCVWGIAEEGIRYLAYNTKVLRFLKLEDCRKKNLWWYFTIYKKEDKGSYTIELCILIIKTTAIYITL